MTVIIESYPKTFLRRVCQSSTDSSGRLIAIQHSSSEKDVSKRCVNQKSRQIQNTLPFLSWNAPSNCLPR